jgi:(E)-4-hydroxy-3-methylbut-2-enyl-diphosphate synthase
VGDVAVGGTNPIRIQSMTTPATTDTRATVDQIVRLVDAGCEIVRVTVPTSQDADNLPSIRREMAARGVRVPLVADIHFTPAAAMRAVEHVEKVRINPGNYADKKKFAVREYSDAEYAAELARIERAFTPLVKRCLELGVAMRIGTNHGSLSDRILNRYGDTPEGMVESALEFVRICEGHGYHDVILSMKASNPVVVLQAYRLLAARMDGEGMRYPLHLGVTEAGDGEDGRIKSAIGIGALLEEGIGDTVRVSLTEDPVAEIPVARALVAPYNAAGGTPAPAAGPSAPAVAAGTRYERRRAVPLGVGPHVLGGEHTVAVEVPLRASLDDRDEVRRELDREAGVRVPEETRAEIASVRVRAPSDLPLLAGLGASMELVAPRVALSAVVDGGVARALDAAALHDLFAAAHRVHARLRAGRDEDLLRPMLALAEGARASLLLEASSADGSVAPAVALALVAAQAGKDRGARVALALDPSLDGSPLSSVRTLAAALAERGLPSPIVLVDRPAGRGADPLLAPASALGGLLCEGIGDSIHVETPDGGGSRRLAFNILQAARVRISKTDFISCPSCGRTLFDLETTTARIKARTSHLKGLKIAIMGCIVNGPGEMADADFGYVGWGDDKIALFVGKDIVAKDIPTHEADERLVDLIKDRGQWVDPPGETDS